MKLADWIPALSTEINGKNSTPNWDLVFHMQAQGIARKLGIVWGNDMTPAEVETLSNEIRAKFAK